MPPIQPKSLALGSIFEYPEPIDVELLIDWFDEQDFEVPDTEAQTLSFGQGGIQFGQGIQVPGPIARKGGFTIVYNPNSNLNGGFPQSSFITVKDTTRARFDEVIEIYETLAEGLESFGIAEDIIIYEVTYEGRVRINENYNVSRYFDQDKLDNIGEIFGGPGTGAAIRVQPTPNDDVDRRNWYQFLIDSTSSNNPNFWEIKTVTRYRDHGDISEAHLTEIIESATGLAMDGD